MAYMQHMAVTLQPSPSGFHRWGRSPGALNVFHGRQSPIASLFRALILFCCRAWSPQNVCCGARSPKYCNSDILVHSALFVVGGESERRMPVYRARGAFLLFGKTGCSGDKSNGTYFSTGNFSKKKEYLLRYYSFLVFTGMIEKSCSICGVSIVSSSLVN